VKDVFPNVKPGEELKITRDLATSPGTITQVHASLDTCFQDIQKLRELERDILYTEKNVYAKIRSSPSFSMESFSGEDNSMMRIFDVRKSLYSSAYTSLVSRPAFIAEQHGG